MYMHKIIWKPNYTNHKVKKSSLSFLKGINEWGQIHHAFLWKNMYSFYKKSWDFWDNLSTDLLQSTELSGGSWATWRLSFHRDCSVISSVFAAQWRCCSLLSGYLENSVGMLLTSWTLPAILEGLECIVVTALCLTDFKPVMFEKELIKLKYSNIFRDFKRESWRNWSWGEKMWLNNREW